MTIAHNRVHAPETESELRAQLYRLFQIYDQREPKTVERNAAHWKKIKVRAAECLAKRGATPHLDVEAALTKMSKQFHDQSKSTQ